VTTTTRMIVSEFKGLAYQGRRLLATRKVDSCMLAMPLEAEVPVGNNSRQLRPSRPVIATWF
jgi:hypothetical protein